MSSIVTDGVILFVKEALQHINMYKYTFNPFCGRFSQIQTKIK